MNLFLFRLEKGILHLLRDQSGKLTDLGFTPLNEPTVGSLYRCKVVEKLEKLGGFFVDCGNFRGFLPFPSAPRGLRVGEVLLLSVAREAFEGKPPRLTSKFRYPEGCRLNNRKGLGEVFRFEYYLKPLLGGSVDKILTHSEVILKTLMETSKVCGFKLPPVELKTEINLAALSRIGELRGLLFSERFPFEGGNLVLKTFEGFSLVDVNLEGKGFKETLDALERLAYLVGLLKLGGTILVDLPRFSSEGLKKKLLKEAKELFKPLGCGVLGFTPLGLLEVVCPKRFKPLRERLGRSFSACGSGCLFASDELFGLFILEKLKPLRGSDLTLRVNPLRIEATQRVKELFEGTLRVEGDLNINLNGFELIN